MDLYIIRHAWAGHFGDPEWPDDSLRPLTPEGKRRFARVVEKLVASEFAPEVVATSPLVRCRQTAEIVAENIPGRPQVVEMEALEPGSDLDELVAWTARQAERFGRVAWVGHAPDVGHLAAALIGQSRGWIHFTKGAVASIRFEEKVAPGEGELRWLATAKILGC